jgi:hypothetical protein
LAAAKRVVPELNMRRLASRMPSSRKRSIGATMANSVIA